MSIPSSVTSRAEYDEDTGSDAAEQFVRRHPGVVRLAKIGWAAKGVVYLLIGILAFTVAANPHGGGESSDSQADPSGAVAKIAQQPYGTVLLWLIAIGLFVYAAWRIVTVLLPAEVDGHSTLRRIGYSVSAATYIALGATAISLATKPGSSGSSGESQDSQITELTRSVMEWPAGRWLVGLAGLVVIGVGAYFLWKGVAAKFEQELEHRSVGPLSWKAISTMGRIGWIGRATMMGLIGVFVVRGAMQFDPDEARGLDDSLRRVADSTGGTALVGVVALGLTLYGAFCVVSSPARKVIATDDDAVAS